MSFKDHATLVHDATKRVHLESLGVLWIDLMEEEIHRFTVQSTINTPTL